MHRLSYRDTLVLRQRTEAFIMSIHLKDLDYLNLTPEEIYEKWVEDDPSVAEQPRELVDTAIETVIRMAKDNA